MSKKAKGTNSGANSNHYGPEVQAYGVQIVNGKIVLDDSIRVHDAFCECADVCGPIGFIFAQASAYANWAKGAGQDTFAECRKTAKKVKKANAKLSADDSRRKSHADFCKTEEGKLTSCQAVKAIYAWAHAYAARTLPGEYALNQMSGDRKVKEALISGDLKFIKAAHHNAVQEALDMSIQYDRQLRGAFVSKTKGMKDKSNILGQGANRAKLLTLKQKLSA